MKNKIQLTCIGLSTIMLMSLPVGCSNLNTNSEPLIFQNTAEISLGTPGSGGLLTASGFTYSMKGDPTTIIFGLFDAPIITSSNRITNTNNLVYGSRTGLADFTRGTQVRATLHAFNKESGDFNVANAPSVPAREYYWAVWGYDSQGNLAFSSPARVVNIP